jgi:hypothetical protein
MQVGHTFNHRTKEGSLLYQNISIMCEEKHVLCQEMNLSLVKSQYSSMTEKPDSVSVIRCDKTCHTNFNVEIEPVQQREYHEIQWEHLI